MDGFTERDVPEQLEALRAEILAGQDKLPKRLREIAHFALTHPDQMALSTLSELSARTQAPASAFVRFAKAFGFRGFKDMQDVFQASVRKKWLSYETRFVQMQPSTSGSMLDAMVNSSVNSLINLRDNFDHRKADEAVSKIMSASTLYLCGSGRSRTVTTYFEYMFTRLGIRTRTLSLAENDARVEMRLATEQDAILAISFMPYREVTKMVVDIAAERNLPLITITDSPASPVNKGISMFVEEQDVEGFRLISTTAILAQYLAVETGRRKALEAQHTDETADG